MLTKYADNFVPLPSKSACHDKSTSLIFAMFSNSSIQGGNRHSTTQDLDGILNVESEQRNALAAVSRKMVTNRNKGPETLLFD